MEMQILALFGLYLAVHLLVFRLFLRARPLFRRESAIMLYHVAAFALAAAALTGTAIAAGVDHPLAVIAAGLSIHGIYSLSFLELWSLAEGSYSLSVLAQLQKGGTTPDTEGYAEMAAIGTKKRDARVQALARAGLVRKTDGTYGLTGRGQFIAAFFRALEWATTGGEADQFNR